MEESWTEGKVQFWRDAFATYVSGDRKTWTRVGPGRNAAGKGKPAPKTKGKNQPKGGPGGGGGGKNMPGKPGGQQKPKKNPVGKDGKVMKCSYPGCGSECHFARDCPLAQQALETQAVELEEAGEQEEENAVKLTSSTYAASSSSTAPPPGRAFGAGLAPKDGIIQASAVMETRWWHGRQARSVMSASAKCGAPRSRGGVLDTACRRGVLGREWLRGWEKERAACVRQNRDFIQKHPSLLDFGSTGGTSEPECLTWLDC